MNIKIGQQHKPSFLLLRLLPCLLLIFSYISHAQTFSSCIEKTQLLELYSSQGCSSCPPAEHWVSNQLKSPMLWQDFIPVVFHVDYWDYIGWKDPFSQAQFSQRQRTYYAQGGVKSVYTPGMVVNGKEWRGWYRGQDLPETIVKPGKLTATLSGNNLQVNYRLKTLLNLNVALLGFKITTNVLAGENKGELFSENFIVLDNITALSRNGRWNIEIPSTNSFNAERYGLAIWINRPNNLKPIQATGGFITENSE